ncbi:MAG: DPP IV N-terminal domain-containing protein [Luteimonas sp.]
MSATADSAIGPSALVMATFPLAAGDMAERYARGEVLAAAHAGTMLLNAGVAPHWTGRGSEFWYTRQTAEGNEHVWVSGQGLRQAAFDSARMAAAVTAATGKPASANALNVESLEPGQRVTLIHEKQRVVCELPAYRCTATPVAPVDPLELRSPDGRQALFMREHDLWLRDAASSAERPLTDDGVAFNAWGAYSDRGLLSIPRQRDGLPFPPSGFEWSPDARFIVGARTDERGIEPTYFLEAVPNDGSFRTKAWQVRQLMTGDAAPQGEQVVFDAASGTRVPIGVATGITIQPPLLGWSATAAHFLALASGENGRALQVVEVNAQIGAVRTVLSERPQGFVNLNSAMYSAPNVRVIRGGRELLWFSERSGFGHLYRYRVADGQLLNAVTQGAWPVRDIIHVDEARGRVLFTAGGHDAANPYRRHLFRVNFDGSELRRLTQEAADHQIEGAVATALGATAATSAVAPDGSAFIDTWSNLDSPPVTVLRSTADGRIITPLEQADADRLRAAGWRAPLPFVVKAADGQTDLHGVLYLPPPADRAAPRSVPLIDEIYAGMQVAVTPHNFVQAGCGRDGRRAAALAELGFAVMVIDGRGTPLRSKAFHDVAFRPAWVDPGLDDHAAVVRQLLTAYPILDPDRVGIVGHSFGGYATARAMLRYPELFKVGVSSAGIHSMQTFYQLGGYLPMPLYAGGGTLRPTPQAVPENYREMDNGPLASRLAGKLLLAWGDIDENAPFASTAHLIDALIKADRRVDLLYLPGRTHSLADDAYFHRRLFDYFVEHLLHAPLPAGAAPAR